MTGPEKQFTKPDDLFEKPRSEEPIFKFTRQEQGPGGGKIERQYVSVMGVELPVRQEKETGTTFGAEEFKNFSLDRTSLDLLKRMAISIKLNQPLLTEGETDIGKTKTLEFLSYLTNTRLIRLSFAGQTDVSEFIGKFVPGAKSARERFVKLMEHKDKLTLGSRAITDRAEKEERNLTLAESREIVRNEGLNIAEANWEWEDGLLPKAMRFNGGEGCWAYFDELGAAEPGILVRMNRVFEKFSRLEIYEQGGKIVEAGPNFRIIATTNPPEYAGRAPFAPDFLRRFNYQKVGGLDLETLKQRTLFLLSGEQKAGRSPIKFLEIADQPLDFEQKRELARVVHEALTEFHYAAQKAVNGGLAKDQKQPFHYDFSDIERVVGFLNRLQGPDLLKTMEEAVGVYYLGKVLADNGKEKLQKIWQETLRLHNIPERINALASRPAESLPDKEEKGEMKPEPLPPDHFAAYFLEELEPGTGKKSFINKTPGRKILVLDKGSKKQPEVGVGYLVKKVKETKPGTSRGVIFVEIIDESPAFKFGERMKNDGYRFITNIMKKGDLSEVRTRAYDEFIEMTYLLESPLPASFGTSVPASFTNRAKEVLKKDDLEIKEASWDVYGNPLPDHYSVWIRKEAEDRFYEFSKEYKSAA